MKFDTIGDLIEHIDYTVDQFIKDELTLVSADDIGLDTRAVSRLYVNRDCIAVHSYNDRTLQYYGGFEYVDKEYRKELGEYVIYLAEDSRVRRHLSYVFEQFESEDEYED